MNRIEVADGKRHVDAQLPRARTAMTHLGRLHRMGKLTEVEDRKDVERLWQHYDTYHHMGPEHSHLVRDEWVECSVLAGTPAEVRRQVEILLQFDIGELTIIPLRVIEKVGARNVCRGCDRQALILGNRRVAVQYEKETRLQSPEAIDTKKPLGLSSRRITNSSKKARLLTLSLKSQ